MHISYKCCGRGTVRRPFRRRFISAESIFVPLNGRFRLTRFRVFRIFGGGEHVFASSCRSRTPAAGNYRGDNLHFLHRRSAHAVAISNCSNSARLASFRPTASTTSVAYSIEFRCDASRDGNNHFRRHKPSGEQNGEREK